MFFSKILKFEFRLKNKMAFKLFEFVEQFMTDTFLCKLTQFEKTGSIGKTFDSLGNQFSKLEINHVFRDFYNFAVR